jgi:HAD superfamily hydrolase (TIGR01549 family)
LLKQPVLGVVFDLDNTLISSSLNFSEIKVAINCPIEVDILKFIDSLNSKQKCEAQRVVYDYEIADAMDAKKLAGTDEVLNLLNRLNIPFAIVTRNNKEAALLKVKNNNIQVPLLLTREDCKAKPAPDALNYLAQYWKILPENLLCVGDYLYDIQMAINANTQSCFVSYGKEVDYANLATFVVHDLNSLRQVISQACEAKHI